MTSDVCSSVPPVAVRGGATAFRQWGQDFLFLSLTAFSPNFSGGNNTVLPSQPHLSGGNLPPLPCGGAADGGGRRCAIRTMPPPPPSKVAAGKHLLPQAKAGPRLMSILLSGFRSPRDGSEPARRTRALRDEGGGPRAGTRREQPKLSRESHNP